MKKEILIISIVLLLFSWPIFSQTIPNNFFGINAWMPDTIGNAAACPGGVTNPCKLFGKIYGLYQTRIQQSSPQIIRFGGINPDNNFPTNFQYIKFIDSVRAIGAEPLIQVSYWDGLYTSAQAANLVTYINITKSKNVKYWSIGNESNLEYATNNTRAKIATYIKNFSAAMKAVDPTILIVAPDLAWYDQSLFYNTPTNDGILIAGSANDITGIVPGKTYYYVDVISYHYYPYDGTQTRATVIGNVPGTVNTNFTELQSYLNTANTSHARAGANALKFAMTEFNINYQNPASNTPTGVAVASFLNGQLKMQRNE